MPKNENNENGLLGLKKSFYFGNVIETEDVGEITKLDDYLMKSNYIQQSPPDAQRNS